MLQICYRGLLFFTLLIAASGHAAPSVYNEYQVKAAFLYHFPKFVELPGNNTLTLCIMGSDPFGDMMQALEGRVTAGRQLHVKRVASTDEIAACRMLFISSSERKHLAPIMQYTRGKQILTVGDTPGYPQQGVIINFYLERSKVRIEVNTDAAARSNLKISSKLLNLARIIHDGQ